MDWFLDFLYDSNYNGLGFSIISILFYLFVYHFVLFLKTREKFYLFYSTYAFTNVLILIPVPYNVFFQDIFRAFPDFFIQLDSPLKFASYILFSYFVIEVVHLKVQFPKFVRFFDYFTLSGTILYVILAVLEWLFPSFSAMQEFFYYVFLPIYFFVMIYGSYLVTKTKDKIRYYILIGSLFLGISAFLVAILTIGQPVEVIDQNYYVYYIGVLLENLLFTFALAVKQRDIFEEKIEVQEELLAKLKENEELREQLNQSLQSELNLKEEQLLTLAADAEDERMERIKADFEREITRLHLHSLRSQMNPHFIFNALNSIKVFLIDKDKDRAILYLNRFSKLIRMVLESSRKTRISLGEELEIAKLYLTLESIRFEDGIDFQLDVCEKVRLSDIYFPPLLLQPFFENAIWHGLMNKGGEKWIKVNIEKVEAGLKMSIRDNGIGRKKSQEINANRTLKKESIGMNLSKDRLQLFNQSESVDYHFEIVDHIQAGEEGTEIVFWL